MHIRTTNPGESGNSNDFNVVNNGNMYTPEGERKLHRIATRLMETSLWISAAFFADLTVSSRGNVRALNDRQIVLLGSALGMFTLSVGSLPQPRNRLKWVAGAAVATANIILATLLLNQPKIE